MATSASPSYVNFLEDMNSQSDERDILEILETKTLTLPNHGGQPFKDFIWITSVDFTLC